MGEDEEMHDAEVEALKLGIGLGMTLIDTAEMYGAGNAEKIVGEAIEGHRKEVFIVSKVLPHNATAQGTIDACNRSLHRMKIDHIDLYLLHWRGPVPLEYTLDAFQWLKQERKIIDYGVSNFDQQDMEEALSLPGGREIVVDQVLYNLMHRGLEWDLLPWCREHEVRIMAYSPIEHGGMEQRKMLEHPQLVNIAASHEATPAQIALAWLLHQEVIVIAKARRPTHIAENWEALNIRLTDKDLLKLNQAFPPPRRKVPLEVR